MTGMLEALDPEMARQYRRGYRHGAKAMLDAVSRLVTPDQLTELHQFLDAELLTWVDRNQHEDPPKLPKID